MGLVTPIELPWLRTYEDDIKHGFNLTLDEMIRTFGGPKMVACDAPPPLSCFENLKDCPSREKVVQFWGQQCWQEMRKIMGEIKKSRTGGWGDLWYFYEQVPRPVLVWAGRCDPLHTCLPAETEPCGRWWPALAVYVEKEEAWRVWCQDFARRRSRQAWKYHRSRVERKDLPEPTGSAPPPLLGPPPEARVYGRQQSGTLAPSTSTMPPGTLTNLSKPWEMQRQPQQSQHSKQQIAFNALVQKAAAEASKAAEAAEKAVEAAEKAAAKAAAKAAEAAEAAKKAAATADQLYKLLASDESSYTETSSDESSSGFADMEV